MDIWYEVVAPAVGNNPRVKEMNFPDGPGIEPRFREKVLKQIMPTFFVALTGSGVSLPLFEAMALLGPDLSRTRLRHALDTLSEAGHGLSKKGLKALQKEYEAKYGSRPD